MGSRGLLRLLYVAIGAGILVAAVAGCTQAAPPTATATAISTPTLEPTPTLMPISTPAPTPTPTEAALTPTTPATASMPDTVSLRGLWPFGPSWAVAAGQVAGKPYAFLASGGGVYVLDVSQPNAPRLVGDTIRTKSLVVGLALSENVLYVAAYDAGLLVYDVASPAAPKLLSSVSIEGAWGVKLQSPAPVQAGGRYAYVVSESSLTVLDVTDPSQPKRWGEYQHGWRAFHVAVEGDRAYVDGQGLITVDISDPTNPTEVDRFTPTGNPAVGDDGRLYVAGGYRSGLQVLDTSKGGTPALLGAYDTPGDCEAVAVRNGRAFVADGGMGLRVYDVTDPASIKETGTLAMGYAEGISLIGDYAYVADQKDGLRVVDISSPDAPEEVGSFAIPGPSLAVAVRQPYAFVATKLTGIKVLDVSDPAMPREVGALDTSGEAKDVVLSG